MGSSASTKAKQLPQTDEVDGRRKMLLQRKVTVDILEKLSRCLPTVSNPLANTLKLSKESVERIEWEENLDYLQEWKKTKRDDATIGNLIDLLKKSGHTEDEFECLFNISTEPRNASTVTDVCDSSEPASSRIKRYRCESRDEGSARSRGESHPYFPTSTQSYAQLMLPNDFHAPSPGIGRGNAFPHPATSTQLDAKDNVATSKVQRPEVSYNTSYCYECEPEQNAFHEWMDFRNLQVVNKVSMFTDSTKMKGASMGGYIPGITSVGQEVLVSDATKRRVYLFDNFGHLVHLLPTGEHTPGGICRSWNENIAICFGRVVALWDKEGRVIGHFGEGLFSWSRGVCADQNNRLIVADTGKRSVSIHDLSGHFLSALQLPVSEQFEKPYHVTVNHKDEILVSDSSRGCVFAFDKSGRFIQTIIQSNRESIVQVPMGLLTDCGGNILLCNYGSQSVNLYNNEGWYLKKVVGSEIIKSRPVTMEMMTSEKLLISVMNENPLQLIKFSSAKH